jgi:hypothetical protein
MKHSLAISPQEKAVIASIAEIPEQYRDDAFYAMLHAFIDDQKRMLACIEFHESEQDGRRYMEECAYDREITHDLHLQALSS